MAENIEEIGTVQRTTTRTVNQTAKPIQISTEPIKQLSKFVNNRAEVEAKAKKQANDLALARFENEYGEAVAKATANVVSKKGEQSMVAYDESVEALRLQKSDLLKNLPQEIQEIAGLKAGKANVGFHKTSLVYKSKQMEGLQKEVYATRSEQVTRDGALTPSSGAKFQDALNDMDQTVAKRDAAEGIVDPNVTARHAFEAKSNMILQNIKASGTVGNFDGAKNTFNDMKTAMTLDDVGRAKIALAKAKVEEKYQEASNMADDAIAKGSKGPEYLRGQAKSQPEVAKRAASIVSQHNTMVKTAQTRSDEKLLESATNEVLREGPNKVAGIITPSYLDGVDPRLKDDVLEIAESVRVGTFNQTTDWPKFHKLFNESIFNEATFAARNLNGYQLGIGAPEMKLLEARKKAILSAKAGDVRSVKSNSKMSGVMPFINGVLVLDGYTRRTKNRKKEFSAAQSQGLQIWMKLMEDPEFVIKSDLAQKNQLRTEMLMSEPSTRVVKERKFFIFPTEKEEIITDQDIVASKKYRDVEEESFSKAPTTKSDRVKAISLRAFPDIMDMEESKREEIYQKNYMILLRMERGLKR